MLGSAVICLVERPGFNSAHVLRLDGFRLVQQALYRGAHALIDDITYDNLPRLGIRRQARSHINCITDHAGVGTTERAQRENLRLPMAMPI